MTIVLIIWPHRTFNEDKQERMYITEQSLTGSRSSATRLEELRPILADTRLAACYDGEHRWLAYQGADNSVILRNIDRKKGQHDYQLNTSRITILSFLTLFRA